MLFPSEEEFELNWIWLNNNNLFIHKQATPCRLVDRGKYNGISGLSGNFQNLSLRFVYCQDETNRYWQLCALKFKVIIVVDERNSRYKNSFTCSRSSENLSWIKFLCKALSLSGVPLHSLSGVRFHKHYQNSDMCKKAAKYMRI